MSQLKELSSDDLASISDEFGRILSEEISKSLPSKEIEDLDLDIIINYENGQLDVDVDVNVIFDALSDITENQVSEIIDDAYLKFDFFIDSNFRI